MKRQCSSQSIEEKIWRRYYGLWTIHHKIEEDITVYEYDNTNWRSHNSSKTLEKKNWRRPNGLRPMDNTNLKKTLEFMNK